MTTQEAPDLRLEHCLECNVLFRPKAAHQMFHSDACRQRNYRRRQQAEPDEGFAEYRHRRDAGTLDDASDEAAFFDYLLGTDEFAEQRALSKGTLNAGGYLVPRRFADRVLAILRVISPLIDALEIFETADGANLDVPTVTVSGSATWTAEVATTTETNETFSQITLSAYKALGTTTVSEELAADSGITNFDEWLAGQLAARIQQLIEAAVCAGDGSAKPTGITAAGNFSATTAASGAVAAGVPALSDFRSAARALAGQYRVRSTWIMHPNIATDLVTVGFPAWDGERLLTRPVIQTAAMATPGANAKSIALLDLSRAYAYRQVVPMRVQRLGERFSDLGQVGFRVSVRCDGKPAVLDAGQLLIFGAT
jgi:HK97 family phage major capsid protein